MELIPSGVWIFSPQFDSLDIPTLVKICFAPASPPSQAEETNNEDMVLFFNHIEIVLLGFDWYQLINQNRQVDGNFETESEEQKLSSIFQHRHQKKLSNDFGDTSASKIVSVRFMAYNHETVGKSDY